MSNLFLPDGSGGIFSEKWTQEVHARCGGEIVVVIQRDSRKLAFVCKGCKKLWETRGVQEGFPPDWNDYIRQKSPIIIPPNIKHN